MRSSGQPVPVLVEAAGRAGLVLLGNRGRGGFASLLLGSVSQQVTFRAHRPVVIVRGRVDVGEDPVVVGVDQPDDAAGPLELAFEMAAERSCPLVAIHAFASPVPPVLPAMPPSLYDVEARDTAERTSLHEALAPWAQKYPHVPVEALIAHGGAAAVLVAVSHNARLLVVGNRGHGSLAGAAMGSTVLQLLHHAECPVLIVQPHTADQ